MEVNCVFKRMQWGGHLRYSCEIYGLVIVKPETSIAELKGKHTEANTNGDVNGLKIYKNKLEFFPRGLHKILPNLVHLKIGSCGLKEISRRDLNGLSNLNFISFQRNNLRHLPNDLFEEMPKLEVIDFSMNNIEEISRKLFDPLRKETLKRVDFSYNPMIDYHFNSTLASSSFADLIQKIEANCQPPASLKATRKLESLVGNFEKLFTTGELSDFSIKVHSKEYKVHKFILATQSSVFKAMFTSHEKEKIFKNVRNFSKESFEDFLRFFYTGKIRNEKNALNLFELAVEFDVPDLKLECEEIVIDDLEKSNALETFNLAHSYKAEKLKQKSFEYIQRMMPEVSDSLIKENELVNEMVAAKRRMEELQQKAKSLIVN